MMDATELPDLDFLLDAAENGSGSATGDGDDPSDKRPFDPNEYADVVQWYNKRTQNIQRHYDTHLEYQKQKLAEENEAGLLEALKQSLDNIESDHMSDFANISSLDLSCASTSVTETLLSSDCELYEEPSMLKKLLLSPTNGDYAKEVDSPNSSDHGSFLAGDSVKVKTSSPCRGVQSDPDGDQRRKLTKTKKPFTELIKHMVTTEKKDSSATGSKNGTTKCVNTKRYMQKYGATQCGMESAPAHHCGSKMGRDMGKTPAIRTVSSPITAAAYNSPALTSVRTLPSSCNGNGTQTGTLVGSGKQATVVVKTLSQREVSPGQKGGVTSESSDMFDHDYCAEASTCSVRSTAVTTTTGITSCSVSGELEQKLPSKVLKWEDYLHRVRAGIRSAPHSPTTCTAKVVLSRPVNNFMVVSTQKVQKLLGNCEKTPHPVQNRKDGPNCETKKVKLQGFEEYMSVLKNKMIVSNTSSAASAVLSVSTPAKSCATNTSAANVLASIIQQKKCEEMQKSMNTSTRSDAESAERNVLRLGANVKGTENGGITGSSGQMLMIHVPAVSQPTATSLMQKVAPPVVSSPVDARSTLATGPGSPSDPRLNTSRVRTVNRPVKDLKIPAMMRLQRCSNEKSAKKTLGSPTFKLVTSGKQGVQAKSLILSGVTGQLKQILTSLAKQQAEKKDVGETSAVSGSNVKEDQETTLQQLLAVISSLHVPPPAKAANVPDENTDAKVASTCENSSTVPSKQCVKHEAASDNSIGSEVPTQCPPVQVGVDAGKPHADIATAKWKSEKFPEMCDQPFPEVRTTGGPHDMHAGSKANSQHIISPVVPAPPRPVDSINTAAEALGCNGANKNIARDINGNHIECCNELTVAQSAPDGQDGEIVHSLSGNGQMDLMPARSVEACQPAIATVHAACEGIQAVEPDQSREQYSDSYGIQKSEVNAPAVQFSLTRSMAAAEMLATDIVDGPVGETLVYDEAKFKSVNNRQVQHPDSPLAVVDQSKSNSGDPGLSNPDHPGYSTLSEANQLFCKLPSYFLNGKLAPEADRLGQATDTINTEGLKNVECDPLINAPVGDEIGYNKLPHYFSSGKSANCGRGLERAPPRRQEPAVKFTTLYKNKHLTPEGTPVNDDETYYSRLPTYYSYGRPHPALKTFSDAVADDNDDTVTLDILDSMEFETLNEADDEKPVSKRKPKRKRRRKHKKSMSASDKLLYSKLPSYYVPSRPAAKRRKWSRSRSPSPSQSSSSDSLYHSSGPCSPRSSEYRSGEEFCSRKRRRSRSRRSGSHRKSCASSTDDQWRREQSCYRGRWHEDESHEKKRLRAMEERRVVYVGRIERSMTENELRLKFIRFGNIEKVSLHFREDGDNYGFVTFQYTCDAFRAIEEGNADLGPDEKQFDLCFGGRREFCRTAYEDLDSKLSSPEPQKSEVDDFDALLQQAKRSIRR